MAFILVDFCLSTIQTHGPSVVESGTQPWVEVNCSFYFNSSEYQQLDIKWYFDSEEEPFMQWVPSSGRQPQTIGQRFTARVTTSHVLTNITDGFRAEQVIHVFLPTIHTSGDYTCKVATFTQESASTHSLVVFGKTTHLNSGHAYNLLFQTLALSPSSSPPPSLSST